MERMNKTGDIWCKTQVSYRRKRRRVIHIRSLQSLISSLPKTCIQTETCFPTFDFHRILDGISLMLIFGCLKFLPPKIHRCWFLDVWNFIWLGGKKVDQWRFASLPWHSPRFDSSLWISRWGCAESLQVEQLLGGVFGSPMLFVTGAFCALFLWMDKSTSQYKNHASPSGKWT